MSNLRKLGVVMWKNWLFRRRQYIMTSLEILLPILFSVLLVLLRTQGGTNYSVQFVGNYTLYEPIDVLQELRQVWWEPEWTKKYTIFFSPNEKLCSDLLVYMKNKEMTRNDYEVEFQGVNSEKEMEAWVANGSKSHPIGISFLDFPRDNSLPLNLHYRIRLLGFNWHTDLLAPTYAVPGPILDIPNYSAQFLLVQHVIALRFIEMVSNNKQLLSNTKVTIQQFPYPPYYKDTSFSQLLQIVLPLFITLSYIFISPTLIKYIVREKELGVKELMKLMGLPGWIQWCGWFASSFVMMTLSAIIIVALLCCKFKGVAVLSYTAPELLFIFFLFYIASAICFCFFITTFFSRPTLATAVGVIVWLLSFFIPFNTLSSQYQKLSLIAKLAVSLFPNMAMAWVIRFVMTFEGQMTGLQWSNLNDPSYAGDNMTLVYVLLMFVVDIILYSFLTWYMDQIFPGMYGVSKPWYFILTKAYWCGRKQTETTTISPQKRRKSANFDVEPTGLKPTITIQHLTKTYGWNNKGKKAVDNLNLNIYEGQITALLGHNGAGKTTTMSMLTGMFPPTSGTAYINGHDIRKDIDKAREDLGLCPQHNMLFSTLTVKEHLTFFGKLKKIPCKTLKHEVNSLLLKLQLWDKRNTLSMSLSGGMKRKLNLGIALIGKPKIIMLDEPTSGMDPEARRAIWDLLQEMRPGRCIVLTTHFMEEADVLGDRIAIMARGQVECCGSPLFLKKRYGAGYHLTISKGGSCNVPAITHLVKSHVLEARVKNDTNAELCLILPADTSRQFPAMFAELERNMQVLGMNNFGMSITTMEEVFLRVGETHVTEDNLNGVYNPTASGDRFVETGNGQRMTEQTTGFKLWLEQICGLLLKRWYYSKRRWILLISQVALPVLIITLVLVISNEIDNISSDSPPMKFSISQYGLTKVFYMEQPPIFSKGYKDSFPEGTTFVEVKGKEPEEFVKELGSKEFAAYRDEYIVGAEFSTSTESPTRVNAWFNGLYYHTKPLTLNLIHNAMVRHYSQNNSFSLTVENYPLSMERTKNKKEKETDGLAIVIAIMVGVFIPVGLSFLSSSFIVFPIHERASKSKHLQLMTGVGGLFFWGTSFIWDFLTHMVCSCIILVVFVTLDSTGAFSGDQSGIIYLLLLLYGWAAIPFTYLVSFLAKLPATGYSRLTIINLIAGIVISITMFMLQFAEEPLKGNAELFQWLFRLLPNFTVTFAFMNMVAMWGRLSNCDSCSMYYTDWEMPGIGRELFMLSATGLLYFVLLALIERGVLYSCWYCLCFCCKASLRKVKANSNERRDISGLDEDVAAERLRVQRMVSKDSDSETQDVLVVHDLSKQFWNFNAVDHLNFGVRNAECFGLLGVNGAGKTTTFQMLTGVLVMTSGNAYANGISLKKNRRKFLQQIGYCPQFDALIDYLTGREMLTVFAHLRGIPQHEIKNTVQVFIRKFDLADHANKISVQYSGGNKRKLSAALAFIGNPPVIFLDEPTTGVDPVARRKLWEIIQSATQVGTSVVLTSHSMEECEVLCSRVAIMVNGQFQCLGGIQYLKNKFSQGFDILAKLRRSGDVDVDAKMQVELREFIEAQFETASLKDVHQGLVQYHVSDVTTKWTHLFATMEDAKYRFKLEDYSVSQATLEQVFLSFARKQRISQQQ